MAAKGKQVKLNVSSFLNEGFFVCNLAHKLLHYTCIYALCYLSHDVSLLTDYP